MKLKKLLSLVLVLVMCCSILPVSSFAEEDVDDGAVIEEQGNSTLEPCVHEYVAGETVEPTCTQNGYTVYTCALCGGTIHDDYTPATDHISVAVPAIPAQIGQSGTTAGHVCSVCGMLLDGCEPIPALVEEPLTEEQETIITIVKPPMDVEPVEGEAVFSVIASVNTNDVLCYQWQKLDESINYSNDAERQAAWQDMEGKTSAELRFSGLVEEPSLTNALKYAYRCVLTADTSSVQTEAVRILTPAGKSISEANGTRSVVGSGECGALDDYVTWSLDDTGTLTIGGSGFMKSYTNTSYDRAPWYSYREQIHSVIIENGVTKIGDYAFLNCSVLTSVSIPNSVKFMDRAFCNCSSLVNIIIPDSITSMNGAFSGCTSLKGVSIPSSLTEIGDSTFHSCISLTSISIPINVTSIGTAAFLSCESLTEVIIPGNVTYINSQAFLGCTGLKKVTISSGVQAIYGSVFSGCSELKSVILPDSVTGIGGFSFNNCSNLTEIHIPASLSIIGEGLFWNCSNLADITIPRNVTKIERIAFLNCCALKTITFEHAADDPLMISDDRVFEIEESAASAQHIVLPLTTKVTVPEGEVNPAIAELDWSGWNRTAAINNSGDMSENTPIIIIPGIMGSRLYLSDDFTSIVWGETWNVVTGSYLGIFNTLYVKGLTKVSGPDGEDEYGTIDTYRNMVNYLRLEFPERDIYFFSYDWRKSNIVSASYLADELLHKNISKAVFICHSMGGLVMSQYIANEDSSESTVDKVITLGTPYEGATRLLQATLTTNTLDPSTPLNKFGNCVLFLFGLGRDDKINLPGVGELTPTPSYWKNADARNKVYSETLTEDQANSLVLDIPIMANNLAGLSGWAYGKVSKVGEKAAKEQTKQWLESLKKSYNNQSRLLEGVTITTVYEGMTQKTKIVPKYHTQISYASFLQNVYGNNYNNIMNAMQSAQAGFSMLQSMGNAYFAVGDTEWTMSGITIVGTKPEDYTYVNVGDETVPFLSANMMYSGAKAQTKYFDLNHGDLAGDHGTGEWKDVKDWIKAVINEENTAGIGRDKPRKASPYKLIKAHCPVDVSITYNGETLNSDPSDFNDETSFGRMDLAGENGEIKIFCLNESVDAPVVISGTDEGTMDYSIAAYNASGKATDERSITDLPITADTTIHTNTNMDGATVLSIDSNGDGITDNIEVLLSSGFTGDPVKLDQEYLMLAAPAEGETANSVQLTYTTAFPSLADIVQWAAVDENDILLADDDPVLTVNSSGKVTPLRAGIAYVYAWVQCGTESYYSRCRIDVVADTDSTGTPIADDLNTPDGTGVIDGIRLVDTSVKVELFRTVYTRVRILPVLKQNKSSLSMGQPVDVIPEPALEGIGAIRSAEFIENSSNTGINEYFSLRVVDDRTLEIVPTPTGINAGNAGLKVLKSSYKAAIQITIEEAGGTNTFNTGILSLSVKKNLPAVKAAAIKLNTYLPNDSAEIIFSGGTITQIEGDTQLSIKTGLLAEREGRTVRLVNGCPSNGSGKLQLLVTVDGWTIKRPVTVSVSAAFTAPKLKVSPAKLSLKPGTTDTAPAVISITPALFADPVGYPVSILHVTESVGGILTVYENEEEDSSQFRNASSLNCSITDGILYVSCGKDFDGSAARTLRVWLRVADSDFPITVKTLSSKNAVKLSMKAAGSIDTAISGSAVTLTPKFTNYHSGQESYTVNVVKVIGKTETDITNDFDINTNGGRIKINLKESVREGFPREASCSYFAYVTADYGAAAPLTAKAKLTVKWSSPAKVPLTVTLKASGTIDVIRSSSSVKLKPTVKNCYTWDLADAELSFYRKDGKVYTELTDDDIPFLVSQNGGSFTITLKRGVAINHKTGKYFVKLTVTDSADPSRTGKTKSFTALKLSMKSAKMTQSVKSIDLLKKDRYSRGVIRIRTSDASLNAIERIVFADSRTNISKDGRFMLVNLGGGDYAIQFTENTIPASLKAATVKLNVFLDGNATTVPNATLSLKVNIK